MRRFLKVFFSLVCTGTFCLGQAPVVTSLQPLNAAPSQTITINGSGFSATPSQLNVWFDHVKGTIASSTPFSIQVQVPPQARFSNVEVTSLTNNLSAKSPLKFLPSYGGASFDVSTLSVGYTNTDATELFDVASSDLDLDGKPDLVVTRAKTPATDLLIYKNASSGIGNINFTKIDKSTLAALNVGVPTANVTCSDLNGDGKPDIITSPPEGNYGSKFFVLKNTNSVAGTISFAAASAVFLDIGQYASRMVARDLNGDGKPEIIVSNSQDANGTGTDNQIYIFPNQSTASTISFGSFIKLTVTGANKTYGLDVQDLDGDGHPDIVLTKFQSNDIFIFRNTSNGSISFSPVQKIPALGSFINITSSDLNNDGLLDLISTATLESDIQVWINSSTVGNISFNSPIILQTSVDPGKIAPVNGGPWGIDVSDIDGDGDADMVVANIYNAVVNIFRQDGALSFTKLDYAMSKPCRNVRVGDYDGDGKPDIALTSLLAAQYSLDVVRSANCWSPVITSPSNTICLGQTIRLTTKPALGVTFTWKKDGTTVQTGAQEYYDATAAATYTVTATGTFDAGCSITSPGLVLTSNTGAAPANPSIINNVACIGGTLNLSTAAVASATYAWTGPNKFTSTSRTPSITGVTSAAAGTYTLQVTVAPCSSPVVSKQVDVAFVPVLPVTATPSAISCVGSSVTLSVSSGYGYQWNKGGAAIGGQTGSSLVLSSLAVSDENDYSVVVTDLSTTCSQETAKTSVKVLTLPVVDFNFSSPQCTGSAISFTGTASGDARGILTYSWDFGDGNTATTLSPTNTYQIANSYSPSLTVGYVGSSAACSSVKNKPITITSSTVPTIQTTASPICAGDATTLSITGTFNSISWGGDNGLTGSNSSAGITKPGNYSVNVTDANGCPATAQITIDQKPLIDPFDATSDKTGPIKTGDHAQLTATIGADSYTWTPAATLSDATIYNPIATPVTNTYYKVVATKAGYCNAVDSVQILIDNGGGANINPPVLFSPNGDTFNDIWKISDTDNYPECTMTIYDGRGSQVYQQKGYNSSNYWDGNSSGKAVPDGTYFYVFSCPNLKPATGNVLVVR